MGPKTHCQSNSAREGLVACGFAVAVFWSALLLFQIQPLIARFLLPWFGGSPAVWTVCLLFFQSMLFVGYAYAHGATRWLPLRWQLGLHVALLAAALLVLPITPSAAWKPDGSEDPTWRIVALLTACIGFPYLLLSSTGPLLQAWFCRLPGDRSPYRLYAVSNVGSLVALLSYPFVVEPALGAVGQTRLWSWLFAGFALVCGMCAWFTWRAAAPSSAMDAGADGADRRPRSVQYLAWFALSMIPSVMLLAVTNQICIDVAVVPLLWILPLTLYLLSFIFCFHSPRWCPRNGWAIAWGVAVLAALPAMWMGRGVTTSLPIPAQIAIYGMLLFACSMVCHGELVRLKPSPRHLTAFYLVLAAGGAAGGLFVAVVAPRVFVIQVELSLAIVACCAALMSVYYGSASSRIRGGRPRWIWLGLTGAMLMVVGALTALFQQTLAGVEMVQRNFYGVLMVRMETADRPDASPSYQLIHGRTMHGMQYSLPSQRRWPTSYYGPESGVGLVLTHHRAGQSRHVGIVGLGIGTLAAYGEETDVFRFYEINPAVTALAERFFTYLQDCPAVSETVLGDARIRLEREEPQEFDVLVLDAFSSDAIPIHLLTEEAFRIYLGHLKRDGILAVHISNVHVDLRPVLCGHARRLGLSELTIASGADEQRGVRSAVWSLLAADPAALATPELQRAALMPCGRFLDWSDDRHSLFEVLR
ncbi:MAG: fused MFS/spermidine synthase [Pirellulaceae bacterium]|nr:fused MFS/spermidine synthase [Pirellulaceae bacterium]